MGQGIDILTYISTEIQVRGDQDIMQSGPASKQTLIHVEGGK